MSIPTDFSPDDDPVLSDERLTDDSDTREEYAYPPKTQMQKAAAARAVNSMGLNFDDPSGMFVETTMTRGEAMKTREPPRTLQYSDLFRQGTPLHMNRPQKPEKYGARTQAALQANIEKVRFMGNAPKHLKGDKVSDYLKRPNQRSTPLDPNKDYEHGVPRNMAHVEPTTKEERLEQAAESPRDAHRDITEHESWRNLMEESPARTAGIRTALDSLTSPRGNRAVNRAMRGGEPQVVMTEDLSVHTPALTGWPGSIDPRTPDLPPPTVGRGRPRKQL
jgi:hypothetical protein